jgi:protein TonB
MFPLLIMFADAAAAPLTGSPAAGPLRPIITPSDYPSEAVRKGWQGDVTVELTVSPKGRVSHCAIAKSSGYQLLDDQTCKLMTKRARFKPATDANGLPVEQHLTPEPVRWRMFP